MSQERTSILLSLKYTLAFGKICRKEYVGVLVEFFLNGGGFTVKSLFSKKPLLLKVVALSSFSFALVFSFQNCQKTEFASLENFSSLSTPDPIDPPPVIPPIASAAEGEMGEIASSSAMSASGDMVIISSVGSFSGLPINNEDSGQETATESEVWSGILAVLSDIDLNL